MMNIVNGGQHADNSVDVQEFMVMPLGFDGSATPCAAACEMFHHLKKVLQDKKLNTAVGDEGGFAPDLPSNARRARPDPGGDREGRLQAGRAGVDRPRRRRHRVLRREDEEVHDRRQGDRLGRRWSTCSPSWVEKYPICSIEDGCSEDDWDGWKLLTEQLGNKVQLVGDDLFVTNTERLQRGIDEGIANSILIKVNQIGTLTETIDAIQLAHRNGYTSISSHRSGETEDATIADLAVALGTGQIKTGSASRSDRMAKYNQLLRIEEQLGDAALYGGPLFPKK